ncbi:ABC-2 type transport system ATP-binding protein [Thermosyntropha lipolytica DSM 11003]|uniref:ABC-2 type transport system ATP-binding protein n=1 Tax=Thermosyntropha lipolytica DSM 11003 TaxID=1123382 RepID=A0A1M5M6X3_9FIRM|nr:ABC transporter ATP-binding protein [Thermosyntropha lipolytica]SHG73017.1 ABC-2 type transport system ATP-binding protein [Thermosyntropha lipolytica DSM 11003]
MIEAHMLTKCFYDLKALDKVSLSVRKASIYGLLGSNGAGKTTLLKIMAGIYQQEEGELSIEGKPVFENPAVKRKIAFIPDQIYYYDNFTIDDMARFYKTVYPGWDDKKYLKLEEVFSIERNRKIRSLSKGMQRQVAFWLAFSLNPELMILDEPLDGLDPIMRKKVKQLLVSEVAERDMTIVISSHNLREIEDLCDYIGILHKGKMLLQKDLDDYKANMHKVQLAFNKEIPADIFKPENGECIEKRGSVLIFISRGSRDEVVSRFMAYKPVILDILPLTLEEVFIYEMGGKDYAVKQLFD